MNFDAGELRERVRFESRSLAQDDYGNDLTGPWTARFTRSAKYIMRPGSEVVLAARLTGVQPVTIIVRRDSQTRQISTQWQGVDELTGIIYAIRAVEDMDRSRQWLSIVAEAGAAA